VSIQERHSYTTGIAAPCMAGQNVIGSIAVIGPAERIKETGIEKLGKIVRRIAAQLSFDLGESNSGRPAAARLRMVK
jgi:DNA-binding IclR family transcriptional regulator